MKKLTITGPFRQLLTMDHLPLKGSLADSQLEIIEEAGIVSSNGKIVEIGKFQELCSKYKKVNSSGPSGAKEVTLQETGFDAVALPGMVDAHTHLCWAGSRANDYALRLEGKSYLEIAQGGGGIWDTVTRTRTASSDDLISQIKSRALRLINHGVTTVEVKSGYGLSPLEELRLLRAIHQSNKGLPIDLVPTCLAAHVRPRDFKGTSPEYLSWIAEQLFPQLLNEQLTRRIDIFIDEGAFTVAEARTYLQIAKNQGFDLVVHGDQFTGGGAALAVELGAGSVDHLEAVSDSAIKLLAGSDVIPVALPGASLGLGCSFAPARKLLNAGCSLAIASDWNPGSAPMGDLLLQAALLGSFEKLTMAETWAGITFRAAQALGLNDRGILKTGMLADFIAFPVTDYRDILYNQGMIKPVRIWKNGVPVKG